MKRNKIAAGALALALGFGAVAPVHAAELDSEKAKDLSERIQEQIKKHEKEAETFDKLLRQAEKDRMEAEKGEGAGSETTEPEDKPEDKPADKPEDKPEDKPADKPEDKPSEKPEDKPSEKPEDKPSEKPEDKPSEKPEDKPSEDKKDEADDEEIKKGPYDTKEEATEAAKKALKAAPTMNEYVVYKDAADKFFFYLRNNSTDGEGKVEEDGNEVVATGKKDDSKESSSPARQADNNAKTGVTGLVSVASILGAASVAYVASKKRD
ncbi:DUF5633 domain-containing protein [uncultured Anaerococcus sp.]|uniref:DUF5633 domain-containing protein n=1 Tax=uncultured Anaerococcus sp. TaxID=293428 RepID=UPI00280B1B25|nr:DUF5633 domain-containing protein [uncultured Anaerococcus sp.]MDU5149844.1 DUF5633 domain-containing protein [Anaerococcus prevotii]